MEIEDKRIIQRNRVKESRKKHKETFNDYQRDYQFKHYYKKKGMTDEEIEEIKKKKIEKIEKNLKKMGYKIVKE
jgi:arsenate reductase-like glutaredoxin family protein